MTLGKLCKSKIFYWLFQRRRELSIIVAQWSIWCQPMCPSKCGWGYDLIDVEGYDLLDVRGLLHFAIQQWVWIVTSELYFVPVIIIVGNWNPMIDHLCLSRYIFFMLYRIIYFVKNLVITSTGTGYGNSAISWKVARGHSMDIINKK